MTLPLKLYAAATRLLEPFAPGVLRGRARRGKEDAARLDERLGHAAVARPEGPLIWLHGVSVGESLSLLPLVEALQRPGLTLLVTSGTVTSAAMMAQRLPEGVIHQFAPVDAPAAVRRFFDHWKPSAGFFVESELWPNLIQQAKARGVRLFLLSARMTEASATGWARVPASARALLSAFDLILPQDAATEARLRRLGANPGPRLNLKLVGAPPPVDGQELARMRTVFAGRKIVLAASTHPPEEARLYDAFHEATEGREPALLVIAPRHPDRGEEIAEELRVWGCAVGLRSHGGPPADNLQVYIADTLGEMGLFYRLADVVVMGGSFVTAIGGHNPLEAARLGIGVITGPYAFNARDVYDELFARAGALEAADKHALARHIRGLLDYPHIARRIGEAAQDYATVQGQALETAMQRLEPLLP